MKKVLRIAAIALVLVIAAAVFTACGQNDAKLIIGKWRTTVELGKLSAEDFEEYSEAIGDLDLTGVNVDMIIEFKEDGTYAGRVDKDSAKAAFDEIFVRMKPAMIEMMKSEMGEMMSVDPAELTEESINALLSMAGLGSIDEMLNSVVEEMDMDSLLNENSSEGRYMLRKGKLYTTESLEKEPTVESDLVLYKLTPTTLTIDAEKGADVPESMEGMLPMTFTKVAE